MAFSSNGTSKPCLVRLPVELLLIIVDLLCETNSSGGGGQQATPSTHELRSLSLVCHHLRQLCLSRLFSRLKITHTGPLRLLKEKCDADPRFAALIKFLTFVGVTYEVLTISLYRQLDLARVDSPEERGDQKTRLEFLCRRRDPCDSPEESKAQYRYGPDILPTLLPRLTSLELLELPADQIDSGLLTTINSHPSLATVAVPKAESLQPLISATSSSLSKIRAHSASLNFSDCFPSPLLPSLTSRGPRLAHAIVCNERNARVGSDTLSLYGLERLDVQLYLKSTFPMAWLPAFVDRHGGLKTIKFRAHGFVWRRNPDIAFPLQFLDAAERQSLAGMVQLGHFSISRTIPASSLDDWPVVHLEMDIVRSVGVSALTIIRSTTPHLSSLVFRMAPSGKQSARIDTLVSLLSGFPSLQRLELHNVSRHLTFKGRAPWALPPSDSVVHTSRCVRAHRALRWVSGRVAQRELLLEVIHLTDDGFERLPETPGLHPWSLEVTYRVQENRDPELHGTPAEKFGRQVPKFSKSKGMKPALQ
ncbi:hypothetical protein DFH06DRAFT_1389119 [Mycena polygramma]|nr:hypothetical protein DFH06DRAFT_1389119 [Mycena polygramma]